MLPRARGRSAGRLACLINFWAALQSRKRSKEKRKSWMGPDSAGTNGSSGVGIRPKTEPNCCSTPPHRWHQRSCPSGGRRQKQQSEMPVAAPACPRGKKPSQSGGTRIFVIPAATLPSARLSSSAGGSDRERNLL